LRLFVNFENEDCEKGLMEAITDSR